MSLADLFVIALGLAMDAFAVSVCKGLSVQRMRPRHALICGVWFGAFRRCMPLLGYWLGSGFAGFIGSFGSSVRSIAVHVHRSVPIHIEPDHLAHICKFDIVVAV